MTTWAVLATGESMSQEIADYVRGKCNVIAISDAYKLAPWADVLVSNDLSWWKVNPEAKNFRGRKFCGFKNEGLERLPKDKSFPSSCNSGLLGMRVAETLGAKKILLLGFNMKGTHYFGEHPEPLKNTTPERFGQHLMQFKKWAGCTVINCTEDSALELFPKLHLMDVL